MSDEVKVPTVAPRQRSGCLGEALRGLLLLVLSVTLATAAVGAVAFYGLGYTLDTPAQALNAQGQLADAQSDLQSLRQQNDQALQQQQLLQTQVADLAARDTNKRELIQELEREVGDLQSLGDQMRENAMLAATLQTEARDNRTAVAGLATADTLRGAQFDDLQRRSERINRFLARLSDIADDTALDLEQQPGGGTAPLLPTVVVEPTANPTATITATAKLTPTATPTP